MSDAALQCTSRKRFDDVFSCSNDILCYEMLYFTMLAKALRPRPDRVRAPIRKRARYSITALLDDVALPTQRKRTDQTFEKRACGKSRHDIAGPMRQQQNARDRQL